MFVEFPIPEKLVCQSCRTIRTIEEEVESLDVDKKLVEELTAIQADGYYSRMP